MKKKNTNFYERYQLNINCFSFIVIQSWMCNQQNIYFLSIFFIQFIWNLIEYLLPFVTPPHEEKKSFVFLIHFRKQTNIILLLLILYINETFQNQFDSKNMYTRKKGNKFFMFW